LDELFADVSSKPRRNEPIHEAMRVREYTLKEASEHLGLYHSTISMIAKRVNEASKSQRRRLAP